MKNIKTKNFKTSDVVHSDFNKLPAELEPIAYIAHGFIQALRDKLGIPLVVTSGYRSPAYNKQTRGSENSFHMWRFDKDGNAIFALDIMSPNMPAPKLYELVKPLVKGETYLHRKLQFVHIAPYGADEEWVI